MLCTGGTRCRGAGQPLPTRAGAAGAHGPSPCPRCQHPAPRRRHPPTPRHQRCRAPGRGGRGGGWVSLRAGGVKGGESGGVGERPRPPRAPRACQACGGSAGCSRGPQACPSTPAEFGTARHGTGPTPPPPCFLPPHSPPATQGAQEGDFMARGGVRCHGTGGSSPLRAPPKAAAGNQFRRHPLRAAPGRPPPNTLQGARLWLSSRQRAQPLLIDSLPISCCSLPACPCGRVCLAQQPTSWEALGKLGIVRRAPPPPGLTPNSLTVLRAWRTLQLLQLCLRHDRGRGKIKKRRNRKRRERER